MRPARTCMCLLQGLYTRVPACYCSACYYLGFAYMMLRRYLDAVRAFQGILVSQRSFYSAL